MNKLKSTLLAAALTFAYAGAAAAEEETGFYAGVGLGQSTIENDDFVVDIDDEDTGFKLFGGYQFNRFFAVEAAYIDGGKAKDSFTGVIGIDTGSGDVVLRQAQITTELEVDQLNVSAVGNYAFNDCFGVLGRAGISYVDATITRTISPIGSIERDDDANEFAYGAGVWFAPTKNLLLRLEYERTEADLDDISGEKTDASLLSLSAVYRFGK